MTTFIFDLAGVLITWQPELVFASEFNGDTAAMQVFFETVLDKEWQNSIDAGKPIADAVKERCALFPQHEALIRLVESRYKDMFGDEIGGTVSVLGELVERGKTVYALGNWSRESFDIAQPKYPFLNQFNDIVLSGDIGILKT